MEEVGIVKERERKKKKSNHEELTLKKKTLLCVCTFFKDEEILSLWNGSTFKSWWLIIPKVCPVHSITYPRFV